MTTYLRSNNYRWAFALLAGMAGIAGCTPVVYLEVQNQRDEAVRLRCWDEDPTYVLWHVDIPARATVRFTLQYSPRSRDGSVYAFVHGRFGFGCRGATTGREISKPKLLNPFYGDDWQRGHTVGTVGRTQITRLILTENDIVVYMLPREGP